MSALGAYPAMAVLRAEDLERARRFYTEVLGLTEKSAGTPSGEVMLAAGDGTMVTLYARPGMPAPQNTTLAFGVPAADWDATIADLRAKGVTFEDYDIPEIGLKTVDGIADMDGIRTAWFLDSEGNILTVGAT